MLLEVDWKRLAAVFVDVVGTNSVAKRLRLLRLSLDPQLAEAIVRH
jgi:hypothetical protein